ncbi:unnamed protein product, partial [Trichobilharzia regenti]
VQSVYVINLPNSDDFIINYIAAAFALKCIDLIHLIAVQCTMDIFLIDWEPQKYHPKSSTTNINNNAASTTDMITYSRRFPMYH